ncbi:nucleoid-structuring protein H-NS [Staphylococcus aureus]|nr:nucleoid-structuring protein H-NS [Staphylococcus aureus]
MHACLGVWLEPLVSRTYEEYETFFNRFDNQEFDFERELTQDPYSKVYLYSIEDHIRTYKIEK